MHQTKGLYPDEVLIDITIADLLDRQAAWVPDQLAVMYPNGGPQWTWKEFAQRVTAAAKGLWAIGVRKGDHVGIWATNIPEWIVTAFACTRIGAVVVTINTNYKQFEVEYLLRQSDCKILVQNAGFKDSDYTAHIAALCPMLADAPCGQMDNPNLPMLRGVVYAGENCPAGMLAWEDFLARGESVGDEIIAAAQADCNPHDTINIQYTSGTTGFPKGVMLTHYNIVNDGKAIGDCMAFTEKDRLCIPVPLFHCFGLVLGIMASLTHATGMVFIESFNPIKVMSAISEFGCTAVHGVPTMFIAMLENEHFDEYDFSTLRTGIMAGSPCPIPVMREVVDRMNMSEITIVFGQTESSPGITQTRTTDSLERRVSTVGRVFPHMEIKIVDPESGVEVPPNTQGEIITRGYQIMKGYYNLPEATKKAIDEDGWLHTGDLGTVDEDGYYRITGRLKDMIIRGGENIYPRELEEFFYTHPEVKDVQVVGAPDEKYGEEVLAFIVKKPGSTVDEATLAAFAKQGLSRHKVPRYIIFIDSFPMNAAGKILKYKLREMGVEQLSLQKAATVETA